VSKSMRTSGAELTTPLAVGCGRANGTLTGVARNRQIFGSEVSTSCSFISIKWSQFNEAEKAIR
jgi:hypothetical protein